MGLIRSREADILALKPFRVPQRNPAHVTEAAKLHSTWNTSDPYAYGRIMTYMQRGIADPDEVARDARHALRVQELARLKGQKVADVVHESLEEAA